MMVSSALFGAEVVGSDGVVKSFAVEHIGLMLSL
jgi:hypothetical protein